MRLRSLRSSWTVTLCASACLAAGAPPRADEPARAFVRWIEGTNDLQVRFTQTLLSGALGEGLTEEGTLAVERPGRLRWDYVHPERKTALVLGLRTLLYIESDRQMIRSELTPEQRLLPDLLAGEGSVESAFELRAIPASTAGGGPRLQLVPKGGREGVAEIRITMRPRDGAIESAEILDSAGNLTEYRFRDVRRNRGIRPGTFDFEPPPGTEILDAR